MDYIVYTDAACMLDVNIFASAYFIRTDDTFVDLGAKPFKGCNIAVAETMAIGLAASALSDEIKVTGKDSVIIYTDRMDCISFYATAFTEKGYPRASEDRAIWAWNKIKNLNKECPVKIEKIHGHREDMNCNKIADRLAKYSLWFASRTK